MADKADRSDGQRHRRNLSEGSWYEWPLAHTNLAASSIIPRKSARALIAKGQLVMGNPGLRDARRAAHRSCRRAAKMRIAAGSSCRRLRWNDPRDPAANAAFALLGSLIVLINRQLALICLSKSHTREA
jgi:hypothetical protein